MADILILGAGVAGLSAAAALTRAGATVTVLDKGRAPGGRVATRRVEGQPVDHGSAFFHGRDPGFLAVLDAVPATRLEGWPHRIQGRGAPCNPAAFDEARPSRRLAFAEGLSALPRHLAKGLDVRNGVRATAISLDQGVFRVTDESGQTWTAPDLILALPVEQAATLLSAPGLGSARALLGTVGTVPCQTVIALYDGDDKPLDAEIFLPEASTILQLISHDSSKRPSPRRRALVLQARAGWSAAHLDDAPEAVTAALLTEAAEILGPWAAAPALTQHHRWRYARAQPGDTLAAPLLQAHPGGARLALTGESFHPSAGVEGAWLAGRRLAEMITGATHA